MFGFIIYQQGLSIPVGQQSKKDTRRTQKIRKRHTKQFGDTSSISLAGLRRLDDNSAYEMVTTL